VAFVLTVRGADVKHIPVRYRRAVRHIVRLRADLFHHVVLPDDISVQLTGQLLVLERTVVLVVAEALGVEANNLAAIGDVIEPVAFDKR
jgi:hypothetical protein